MTAAQVCQRGYSSSVRNVPAEVSREVYREYGITQRTAGEYEVDHLVPLELGGSNDIAKLWPEAADPRPGFHEKDQVENSLHDQVCGGGMGLLDAQRAIATNWLDVSQHLPQRAPATPAATAAPAPVPGSASGVEITSITGERPGGRGGDGPDGARSCVFAQLSHSGGDRLNSPGVRVQGRGRQWDGVVELEHRNLTPAWHGYGDHYLQRRECQQPHPDWLKAELMLMVRDLAKCITWITASPRTPITFQM